MLTSPVVLLFTPRVDAKKRQIALQQPRLPLRVMDGRCRKQLSGRRATKKKKRAAHTYYYVAAVAFYDLAQGLPLVCAGHRKQLLISYYDNTIDTTQKTAIEAVCREGNESAKSLW